MTKKKKIEEQEETTKSSLSKEQPVKRDTIVYTDNTKMNLGEAIALVPELIPFFLTLEDGESCHVLVDKWKLCHAGEGLSFENKDRPVIQFSFVTEAGVRQHREYSVYGEFVSTLKETELSLPALASIEKKVGQYGIYQMEFLENTGDNKWLFQQLFIKLTELLQS